MLLAQRSTLPNHFLIYFDNSSILHVAVSGLHVGLIRFACFLILLQLAVVSSLYYRHAILIRYMCLVGFRPSVIRTKLMAALILNGQDYRLWHRSDKNILVVAALIILLAKSVQLWDLGFQLSFVATCSIIYFNPKLKKMLVYMSSLRPRRILSEKA